MPPSSRPRFWTPVRAGLASLAIALPALTLQLFVSACGADSGGATGAGGGAGSVEPVGTSGVGGVDGDATVPDGQPDVEPPTFAELCGDGECIPGEVPEPCGLGENFDTLGCHVVLEDGEPASECGPTGDGATDAPCQTSADCVPGNACVPTEGSNNGRYSGVCRPYCCGDVESCPSEPADGGPSFCAPRPRVGDVDLDIPVCVPVAPCELLSEGACPDGKTCGIVRTDGTTSCVEPGSGVLCEGCPCADGLICARNTNVCLKLCHTEGADDECGDGRCQGGSADYPPGFGICVGGENSCD